MELRLKVRKRVFPSHGRARLNTRLLPDLGIAEGDRLDLVNVLTKKTVSVASIADTMVGIGEIRVSEEDLRDLGIRDGEEVLVRKTPPLADRAATAVHETEKRLSEETEKLRTSVKKTGAEVKVGAGKAAEAIRSGAEKAGKKVHDAIEETRGKGKDL